jgi:hypothetical protein
MRRSVLILVGLVLVLGLAGIAVAGDNAEPGITETKTTFSCAAKPCSFSASVVSNDTWPRDISWVTWYLPHLTSGTLQVRFLDCCIVGGDMVGGATVFWGATDGLCVGSLGAGSTFSECTITQSIATSMTNAVLIGFAHVLAGGGLPAGATVSGSY